MNAEQYTDRARGFIHSAQSLATREGNQQFTPLFFLRGLLDDGLAGGLIDRWGGYSWAILNADENALAKLPKVTGAGAGQIYLAPETARLFTAAERAAEKEVSPSTEGSRVNGGGGRTGPRASRQRVFIHGTEDEFDPITA